MKLSRRYSNISRAALAISYDNGGINRDRPKTRMLATLDQFLAAQDGDSLPRIDAWLATLSADDMETVCAGEETDRLAILQSSPPGTEEMLVKVFEEVA